MDTTDSPKPERVRTEPSPKRVRAYVAGVAVADTTRPMLVWEVPYYPTYYFPAADVRSDLLVESGTVSHSPSRGDARHYTVEAGGTQRHDAALRYHDSPVEELRDLVRFEWEAMDGWFEEDEEVFTHARDPHSRVDILAASRRVVVRVEGTTVADSTHTHVLYETGLPPRWYFPKVDVRMDLLVPTDTVSHCPYKGQARYWSALVEGGRVDDIAWSYRAPFPESQKVAGMVAFYNERVDLTIDGVPQEPPRTPFS